VKKFGKVLGLAEMKTSAVSWSLLSTFM